MDYIHFISTILVIVGAINWGTVGLLSLNLVDSIFNKYSKYIYIVVGAAGTYLAVNYAMHPEKLK